MIYVKKHTSGNKVVVGVCDSDLVGKKFTEDGKALSISEFFFKGELVDKEKAAIVINSAHSINIIGKEAIEICLDLGLVLKGDIFTIAEVPYAIIFEIGEE